MGRQYQFLWIFVIGLLVYFGIRIHNLDSVPLFLDESINIERSVNIINGTYLEHARTGKFLLPYLSIPFQPHINAVWSVRLSLLLITCLGIACAFAITKHYAGVLGGMVTLVLMTFSPMLFLFDRFALSDTLLHVTLTIWILSLFKLFGYSRFRWQYAMASGVLFVVSMLAKSPTLFLAPLSFVFVIFIPRWTIINRVKSLIIFYGTVLALWLPFTFLLSTRKIDYFGKADHIAPTLSNLLDFERILNNLSFMLDGLITYHGGLFIAISVVVIVIAIPFKPRVMLTLCAGILGYGVAIITIGGFGLFIRYFAPMMPLLFIALGIGCATLVNVLHKRYRLRLSLVFIVLGMVWIITTSFPFMSQIYSDPHNATLVPKDRSEYMRANSSGFGILDLRDALVDLASDAPIVVEGAIVSCYTLTLYMPKDANVMIQCPNVLSGERRAKYLNQYLPEEAQEHERYYVVFETEGIVSYEEITTLELTPIAEFPRPGNGIIQLFRSE